MREQIQEAFEDAVQNPERAENNGRLGMLLYGYEHFQFAETCFERARALIPTTSAGLITGEDVQAALGKHDQAAISLREALRQNPDYLPAELSLRNLSVLRANWTRAEKPTRRLQRSIPKGRGLLRLAEFWPSSVRLRVPSSFSGKLATSSRVSAPPIMRLPLPTAI